jgi:hypothetical protein
MGTIILCNRFMIEAANLSRKARLGRTGLVGYCGKAPRWQVQQSAFMSVVALRRNAQDLYISAARPNDENLGGVMKSVESPGQDHKIRLKMLRKAD